MKYKSPRSEYIALAKEGCALCLGLGLRQSGKEKSSVACSCTHREIFRICYRRFRHCSSREKHISMARLELVRGTDRSQVWGLKDEEYIADFCNVARRTLTEAEHRLFRYHFLLGADWKLCCRRLNLERGRFFHAVYRIQQKLGKVFAELQPYALYPLDDYFAGTIRRETGAASNVVALSSADKRMPVRPPVRKAA